MSNIALTIPEIVALLEELAAYNADLLHKAEKISYEANSTPNSTVALLTGLQLYISLVQSLGRSVMLQQELRGQGGIVEGPRNGIPGDLSLRLQNAPFEDDFPQVALLPGIIPPDLIPAKLRSEAERQMQFISHPDIREQFQDAVENSITRPKISG